MTTYRDITVSALGYSARNISGQTASNTELFRQALVSVRRAYAIASVINPSAFAEVSAGIPDTAGPLGQGWARPSTMLGVIRIELANKTKVRIAPYDEVLSADIPNTSTGHPVVYQWGAFYYAVANDPLTGTDLLTFMGSERVADPVDIDTSLPASWESHFDDMLVKEVALYLSLKDGRTEEYEPLQTDLKAWRSLFAEWLGSGYSPEFDKRFAEKRG